jgi:hypothetical protein
MTDPTNRNNQPLPIPAPLKGTKQQQDAKWSKSQGMARIRVDNLRADNKAEADLREVWEWGEE